MVYGIEKTRKVYLLASAGSRGVPGLLAGQTRGNPLAGAPYASRTERSKREERETEIHVTTELLVRNYTRRRDGNVPGSRERKILSRALFCLLTPAWGSKQNVFGFTATICKSPRGSQQIIEFGRSNSSTPLSKQADYRNKHPMIFAKATDPTTPIDVRIATITRSANVLALAVGKNNTIIPLHSFMNVGGTLTNPANKVIALCGISNKATAIRVDEDSVFTLHVKSRAPLIRDIEACDTVEAVSQLADLSSDRGCANLSGLCIPPPYLAKEFLHLMYDLLVDIEEEDSEEGEEPAGFKGVDPKKLLEIALTKVKEFKTANETDVTYQGLGLDSVSYLIRFRISVSRGFIAETVLEVNEDDEVLKTCEVSQHESSTILPHSTIPIVCPASKAALKPSSLSPFSSITLSVKLATSFRPRMS
eukprot:scaffold10121_cov64-Cyclotella_meneghiniana.AAC.3